MHDESQEGLDKPEIPVDVPEADAEEQNRAWKEDAESTQKKPELPPDAPEADVLDQSRPADLDDDERPD